MALGELVDDPESDVVTTARVRTAGIAEAHDHLHPSEASYSPFFAPSAGSAAGAAVSAAAGAPSTGAPSGAASTLTSSTVGGETVTIVKFVSYTGAPPVGSWSASTWIES